MKIFKVRYGDATNSSSSHSVVFWRGDASDAPTDVPPDDDYGWDEFVLASPEEKKKYMEAMWFSMTESWEDRADKNIPSVDHQSVWELPNEPGTGAPNRSFFEAVSRYVVNNPKIFIFGGNDNSESDLFEKYGPKAQSWRLTRDLRYGTSSSVREDKRFGFWTLLTNGYEGPKKYRFTLDENDPAPVKAYSPELVDIKITDYCTYGCSFCYQGSTRAGRMATKVELQKAVQTLAKMKVMEVAIGGGEPTTHPHLYEFIGWLKEAGIRANVTTRNKDWVSGHFKSLSWDNRYSMGIGLSISSPQDRLKQPDIGWSSVTNHVVIGETSPEDLFSILIDTPRVLLLDYKTTGRGYKGPTYSTDDWISVVRAARAFRLAAAKRDGEPVGDWTIGIDTPLAKRCAEDLKGAGVDPLFYETEEGKFSAYWDLVAKKIGPCSYQPEKLLSFDGFSSREFLKEFSKW